MQECLNKLHLQSFFNKQLNKYLDDLADPTKAKKSDA